MNFSNSIFFTSLQLENEKPQISFSRKLLFYKKHLEFNCVLDAAYDF